MLSGVHRTKSQAAGNPTGWNCRAAGEFCSWTDFPLWVSRRSRSAALFPPHRPDIAPGPRSTHSPSEPSFWPRRHWAASLFSCPLPASRQPSSPSPRPPSPSTLGSPTTLPRFQSVPYADIKGPFPQYPVGRTGFLRWHGEEATGKGHPAG